jgi:hypothetical protein
VLRFGLAPNLFLIARYFHDGVSPVEFYVGNRYHGAEFYFRPEEGESLEIMDQIWIIRGGGSDGRWFGAVILL